MRVSFVRTVIPRENRPRLNRLRSFQASTAEASLRVKDICQTLGHNSTNDQWQVAGQTFKEIFDSSNEQSKTNVISYLGNNFGVDTTALDNAITLYSRNKSLSHEVKKAATPLYQLLFQAVGNREGGVKLICDMRAHILAGVHDPVLRRVEEASRELLTTWFCLSNLKLERLTWQSPADILHKVARYEAVHPVAGLTDLQRRVGEGRRCFLFTHEAMPREPLVVVHVALMDRIADNIQDIIKSEENTNEDEVDTAIYYSISSTQKGLSGIDLGNLLIKEVVSELQRDTPWISVHCTLSPIPGFRAWVVRSLKGNSEFGDILDDKVVAHVGSMLGKKVSKEEARVDLLSLLEREALFPVNIEPLKDVLMRWAAIYLLKAKRNGFALNPVANFHIRNGAEVYRINWAADSGPRGMERSYGLMVNYRYNLADVHMNTHMYTTEKEIAANEQVLSLIEDTEPHSHL